MKKIEYAILNSQNIINKYFECDTEEEAREIFDDYIKIFGYDCRLVVIKHLNWA